MTPEKKVETKIKKWLAKQGAWFIKAHGHRFQRSGTSDLLCCLRGRFIAIEVKRAGITEGTKLQEATLADIRKAGGIGFVADSLEVVIEELTAHGVIGDGEGPEGEQTP